MRFFRISAMIVLLCLTASCVKKPPPANNPPMDLPEYPVIDGSSSTVVMHAAIRAYLTDEHFVDEHSQTYAALERLIPGNENPADVILAVKYYNETLKDAKERGADLVITPVAKEGFVFILHKDNPIDSLTQQQIRDIYSGKVTNWKQVGGKDEEIIPYTRNWDSGSQTAMEDFMDGTEMVGEEDNVITGMSFMLTQVERTGSAGIGYSILSWYMGQSLDSRELKAVAVDKIKPNNENLADSSYPLMVYTYSYYNQGNEKGKNLTDWLLTDEGQRVIASAEYVGINGELPPENFEDLPNLYKDEYDSSLKADEYYPRDSYGTLQVNFIDLEGATTMTYEYSERVTDRAQTATFANGKEKAITVLRVVHFSYYYTGLYREHLRFIVLTREKGGEFEVINEGEVLSYEDGVVTPKGSE